EEKRKPSGRRYVYYHCTRRLHPRCRQPYVRAEVIDKAVAERLDTLSLSDEEARFLIDRLREKITESGAFDITRHEARSQALEQARRELHALTGMRLRNLLDDAEYLERKRALQESIAAQEDTIADSDDTATRTLELGEAVVSFRKYAAKWFGDET